MKKYFAFAIFVAVIGHFAMGNAATSLNAHHAAIEAAASY